MSTPVNEMSGIQKEIAKLKRIIAYAESVAARNLENPEWAGMSDMERQDQLDAQDLCRKDSIAAHLKLAELEKIASSNNVSGLMLSGASQRLQDIDFKESYLPEVPQKNISQEKAVAAMEFAVGTLTQLSR